MNTVDGDRLIRPGNFGEDLSCIELKVETYIWTEIYYIPTPSPSPYPKSCPFCWWRFSAEADVVRTPAIQRGNVLPCVSLSVCLFVSNFS